MKRPTLLVALATSVLLVACGGSSGPTITSVPGGTPAATTGAATTGEQFGGDPCSALTSAEIEAATYPQGKAVFDSTDTQKDDATGKPVVCQWLVKFGDNPSAVGAALSYLDPGEYANRAEASTISAPVAVPNIGSEAWLIEPVPGFYEVWVTAAHGLFKLEAESEATAIALARIAAGRD